MKRVFISQPMRGKTLEEIMAERKQIIEDLVKIIPKEEIIVLDSLVRTAPPSVDEELWYLGESLKILSRADIAYFAKGWKYARGCIIEHDCAEAYGIGYLEYDSVKSNESVD